jgi:hypothetical protein
MDKYPFLQRYEKSKRKAMTVRTKFDWTLLSAKPDAIDILSKNLDKLNWDILSLNPAAIHILEQNPKKINWDLLSCNPSAIEMLKANPDKINRHNLSFNPNRDQLKPKYIDFGCFKIKLA